MSAAEEARALRTPEAVRAAAERAFAYVANGESKLFALELGNLSDVVARVVTRTTEKYGDFSKVPYHAREAHFRAGGVDRLAFLRGIEDPAERFRASVELVVTSVLLDAGAGASWSYVERSDGAPSEEMSTASRWSRSEGLAVASLHAFRAGLFSSDAKQPWRADADGLSRVTVETLGDAFQVGPDNPLVGLEGRAALLRTLGARVRDAQEHFGADGRLGGLADALRAHASPLPARAILIAVLDALSPIWPSRETLGGVPLGDTWKHPALGYVPFHKLSQWLSYSLLPPLEQAGVVVRDLDALTGLPEYRNGGLFVDAGVIVPRDLAWAYATRHEVGSPFVVEWRALTVALLDRTAELVRREVGMDAASLPLARVLEGGTWAAGRIIAKEKRDGGTPPFHIVSDGTVF